MKDNEDGAVEALSQDPLHLIGPRTALKGGVMATSPDDGSEPAEGAHRR